MSKIKNLIVGCGLSGIVLAERIASELNEEVLIIDKRDHIGGNCYDYKGQDDIIIHKYGPHAFHTKYKEVWDYLSKFTSWHYFTLKSQIVIDNEKVTLPFNINTIYEVFPEYLATKISKKLINTYGYNKKIPILELKNSKDKDLKFLAEYVYKKIFEQYTVKQWGVTPEEIDKSVTSRVPVLVSKDNGYFQDKYQAIPLQGYTKMMNCILDNPLIKVQLNTDFKDIRDNVKYDKLFYSGAIDEFFNYEFGALPYRSLYFDIQEKNVEYYQNTAITNYPNNYDFTRISEYKYFLDQKTSKTTIAIEYPQEFEDGKNERYYPIANDSNLELYEKYLQKSKNLSNVYFFGRLGDYKYYNMDETIKRALDLFKKVKENNVTTN